MTENCHNARSLCSFICNRIKVKNVFGSAIKMGKQQENRSPNKMPKISSSAFATFRSYFVAFANLHSSKR